MLGCTSTSKSTGASLIVRGLKCVINSSIEFAPGDSKSTDYRV